MPNVYHLFESGAQSGNTFIQDASGNALYQYKDLEAVTARYANLLTELGVKPGDRVMVQVEKSAECLMLYFACLRSGCIYVPLNTAYKMDELSYFIDNAEPALIVCDPAGEPQFNRLMILSNQTLLTMDDAGNGSFSDRCRNQSTSFQTVSRNRDDVAVIIYTSGTTGRPKGAMITHENLETNCRTLSDCWGWRQSDVMLHALPIFHVHGLFVGTHLPVMNGCTITLINRFDADQVIDLLPNSTVYMGVPTHYTRLLAQDGLTVAACRNMRLFTSGSAPLRTQTFEAFREHTGHTIVERYGMSETGMNTSNPLDAERKAGSVGLPLHGIDCRIVGDDGSKLHPGATGHLELKGPNVFKGYWGLPEKTALEFTQDGYFRTGDLAVMDDDGYISIAGRNKDMIITGGLNVYPKEIEILLDDLDGIRESAVIGLPDADFGEAVTGVIVPDGSADLSANDVISYLKHRIANFKVAKQIYFVEELPRNAMGKVQKNSLRKQFSSGSNTGAPQ